jgi:hypothetical protein
VNAKLAALAATEINIPVYLYVANNIDQQLGSSAAFARANQMAAGGLVKGVGTSTSDSNPVLLSKGEFVMPANVVGQPGMLGALEAMRNSGGSGGSLRPAAAPAAIGAGTSITNVYVNVAGSVTSERDLADRLVQHVDARRRRVGKSSLINAK